MTPPALLVTGATGYIGGRLVPRLLAAGRRPVRCLVRTPARVDPARWPGAEVVAGNVLEPATLAPALEGVSTAYYLVHSMAAGERGFIERDLEAAGNFGRAAKAAGVGRVIYLGGLGGGTGGAAGTPALSPHLESRQKTGEVLRATGPPLTELRAAVIVGSGSMSFEMVRYLTERLPVLIAPRWVSTRCQPIAIRDVLSYLVACLDEPRSAGRIIEIGGADVLSYCDMMLVYAKVRGLTRRVIHVPVLTPWLSSLWVDLVTPIPAAFARPLIEGVANEVVVRSPAARELFPEIHPIGYEEAVRHALERVKGKGVETTWSGSTSSAFDRAPHPPAVESHEGLLVERRERSVAAPADVVYEVFAGLGGDRGWGFADPLWQLRGWIDRAAGGPGMRRGRRDPDDLRAGDAIDFWRVEAVERGRSIRLAAEMRVPGRAWLELRAVPGATERSSVLRMAATFEPRGLAGLVYWYALQPIHGLIFAGLLAEIGRRAEQVARGPAAAPA